MDTQNRTTQSNLLNFFGGNMKVSQQPERENCYYGKKAKVSFGNKKKSKMTLFDDQDPEYELEEEQKPRTVVEKIRNVTPLEQILTWRNDIKLPHANKSDTEIDAQSRLIGMNDFTDINWSEINEKSEIEGMLINWEWDESYQSQPEDEIDMLSRQFDEFSSMFKIPESLQNNGICWVVTPKKMIAKMIEFMAHQNYGYVENIVVCQLQNPTHSMLLKAKNTNLISKNDLSKNADLEQKDINEASDKENFTNENLGKRSQPSISSFFSQGPAIKKQPFGSSVLCPTKTQELTALEEATSGASSKKTSAQKEASKISKKNLFLANGKCDFATLKQLKVEDVMINRDSGFFYNTKKTILMFRRFHKKLSLELRHQRNPDCFFDVHFEGFKHGMDDFGKERIYSTIETLLPKANSTNKNNQKLLEINGTKPRPGWITLYKKRD